MTNEAQNNLIAAMYHNAVAKHYLEQTTHLVSGDTKRFLNVLLNRLKANEADMRARIGDNPKSLAIFDQEITKSDLMQYDHIVLQLMGMEQEQRDLVEKLVDGIKKGEVIEFNEQAI